MKSITSTPKNSRASAKSTGIHAAVAAAVLAGLATFPVFAEIQSTSVKLLTAQFVPRQVVQVEAGDFHFQPGQVAPIHSHSAPAIGYVTKGTIIYQIEGEKQQILNEGDAFFEPVGLRILRFDNASATEEAIFVDINLEQEGEPFIVFEKAPTEAIDRRSLPTFDNADAQMQAVDVHANDLAASGELSLDSGQAIVALITEGIVELQVNGQDSQRLIAGQSVSVAKDTIGARIVNASGEVPAQVITFALR